MLSDDAISFFLILTLAMVWIKYKTWQLKD